MKKSLLIACGLVASFAASAQVVRILEPVNLAGLTPSSFPTNWSAQPDMTNPANAVTGMFVYAESDTVAVVGHGCGPITNAAAVAGKIAVIRRGTCAIELKAANAQAVGAIGCVILNNAAGALPNPADDPNSEATIPTAIISDTAAARLVTAIKAGTVKGFLGKEVYKTNLSIAAADVVIPMQAARPGFLATGTNPFKIEPTAKILNDGTDAQSNFTIKATILKNGQIVATETKTITESIEPGAGIDSAIVDFTPYAPAAGYEQGAIYTLSYELATATADEDQTNNMVEATIGISEKGYTYGAFDMATQLPVMSNATAVNQAESNYSWCMVYKENNNSGKTMVRSFNFATTAAFAQNPVEARTLEGEYMTVEVIKWNDAFVDIDDAAFGFTDLETISTGEYTYDADRPFEPVTVTFPDEIELIDNQRYMVCLNIQSTGKLVGVAYSADADFSGNQTKYRQVYTPLIADGQAYYNGFGLGTIPSLVLNVENVVGVSEKVAELTVTPSPNPASTYVTIPVADASAANVEVIDVTGKVVANIKAEATTGALRMNVEELANGVYTFKVAMGDAKIAPFKVVVAK